MEQLRGAMVAIAVVLVLSPSCSSSIRAAGSGSPDRSCAAMLEGRWLVERTDGVSQRDGNMLLGFQALEFTTDRTLRIGTAPKTALLGPYKVASDSPSSTALTFGTDPAIRVDCADESNITMFDWPVAGHFLYRKLGPGTQHQ